MAVSPAFRIRMVFFLHALASGGIYPRIPDIEQRLGIDEATLGLDFLGFTIGTILVFMLASTVIERAGTKPVMLLGLPALPVGTALLAMMPNALALFALFLAYGALYGMINIAVNIEADRIEAVNDRRIMNSCHGIWSFGYLLATLLGTLAAGLHLSPALHLWLVAVPVAILAVVVVTGLTPAPPRPHSGGAARTGFALPSVPVLLIVAFVLGPSLLEGALRNWSVIYMRQSFAAPEWVDTLTLPVFLVAQATGRMLGDTLVMRFGAVRITRALMAVAFLGLMAVTFAPVLEVALFGFLLIGVGLSVYYPLTTSAAARLGDRPASQNVAALTSTTQVALLGAPAVLGLVAAAWGTRWTFGILLPGLAAALWLVRYLEPRRAIAAAAA